MTPADERVKFNQFLKGGLIMGKSKDVKKDAKKKPVKSAKEKKDAKKLKKATKAML